MPVDDHGDPLSPTPEEHLDLARVAIEAHDAKHAAHHLAGVLAIQPRRKGFEAVFDAWLALAHDPLALVPLSDGVFHGDVALHAFVLQRRGETSRAVALLLAAQAASPNVPYVEIAETWLASNDAVAALELTPFAGKCVKCALAHGDLAAALVPLMKRVIAAREPDAYLAWAASKTAREAGDNGEALEIARIAHQRAPAYWTALAIGAVHRDNDHFESAIDAFREALVFDPNDLAARLDIGDLSIEVGDFDAALVAYAEVLERDPEHVWALPSTHYLLWRQEGDTEARAHLGELAASGGAGSRAAVLFEKVDPYARCLTPPSASLVNLAKHHWTDGIALTECAVSSIEAPSAVCVVQEMADLLGRPLGIHITFGEIPTPDPRVAKRSAEHPVWSFRKPGIFGILGALSIEARPALAPPPEDVSAAITAIASTAYERETWWLAAHASGRRLGPEQAVAVLATMVHPPKRPTAFEPWDWPFRVQVAAAFVLTGVDDGWTGSARQKALVSLLHGPVDWTTTAGILALVEIAHSENAHAKEIVALLVAELDVPLSPTRYVCIVEPLVRCAERLPLEDSQTARFTELRRTLLD